MAGGRRVLITNIRLAHRTGTEVYCCDLAVELRRRGQTPVVYSPQLGPLAEWLRGRGVEVTDDLATVAEPDVIHGHHTNETALAVVRFPGVPAVFVAHSATAWFDESPRLSAIRAHVAVDLAVRERMHGDGVAEVRVIGNGIDLKRFRLRDTLPDRPRRALILSNSTRDGTWADEVRAACSRAGLGVDVVGLGVGPSDRPEKVLPNYDLVFAKARCAMEGLATGAAVIVCDSAGVGGLVTPDRVAEWRPWNFGLRTMTHPHAAEILDTAIDAYRAEDAMQAAAAFRSGGGLVQMVDDLVAVHNEVVELGADGPNNDDRIQLAELLARGSADRIAIDEQRLVLERLDEAGRRLAGFASLAAELSATASARAADVARLTVEREDAEARLVVERRRRVRARNQIAALKATRTWRLRGRLVAPYAVMRRRFRR